MRNLFLGLLFLSQLAVGATVKPNQLAGISNSEISAANDLFMLFDASAGQTKKITVNELDTRWGGGGSPVTSVTASSPLSSTGGTTPNIVCQVASSSLAGCISSASWNLFNNAATVVNAAASANTVSTIVKRDGSGNFSAGTITAALSGNASTASALANNPTDCSANEFANAIAASGNLSCANPFTGFVESYTGHFEAVSEKTYTIDHYAAYAKQIVNLRAKCTSGSVTIALKIGGTSITTCSAISVTGTSATTTCDTGASNDLAANGELTMVASSNSSCTDFVWAIKTTRD